MNKEEAPTPRILTPSANHYLTQAADVPIDKRIIATLVVLSEGAAESDWREIDSESAEEYNAKISESWQAKQDTTTALY
jgi:hypothetical protein